MAEHLPAFRPSSDKRIAIKPAGWIAIAIVLVALVGGTVMGLDTLSGRGRIKPLSASDVEAQHAQTLARNVWWQPRLRAVTDPITGKTYWMAPDKVAQEVIAHHRTTYQQESTVADGVGRAYEVKDFSEDGLECTLGVLEAESTLTLYRVRYNPQDQRWKTILLLCTVEHK
jgi:hypothetical protein